MKKERERNSYWQKVVASFFLQKLALLASLILLLFVLVAIYAPFLASSKPLFVIYDGKAYFPLFRYLFYSGFYTKELDLFFNLMIFTLPLALISFLLPHRWKKITLWGSLATQIILFLGLFFFPLSDPAGNRELAAGRNRAFQQLVQDGKTPSWQFELDHMTPYAKLNLLLKERNLQRQDQELLRYREEYLKTRGAEIPSLWRVQQDNEKKEIEQLSSLLNKGTKTERQSAEERLEYIQKRSAWIGEQQKLLHRILMPMLSQFHWEEDAGGQQALNQYLDWWQLTRINRKDLTAALIFGIRVSLVVGFVSIAIALLIGIPVGAYAGFYGGKVDVVVSRLLEIWEAMPTFFMLLLITAFLQSKSIVLIILIIGLFGWTGFSRYIRGEFFKQRHLPYVEACQSLGFEDHYIIFKQILPNAIPPVLTLLPFAVMGAITSEAGLSFLGLGEENSCSWGVLMDEGRSAFPAESYLLWPPALLLTLLLVAIAIVGDALRDAIDPKLKNRA